MELFIALDFDEPVLAALTSAGSAIQRQGNLPGMQTEFRDDLHLTLRYLGSEATPQQVIGRLAQVTRPPFRLTLGGLGVFENRTETVLWAGVEGAVDQLRALKRAADAALSGLPLPPEPLPFSPHITLASLPAWGGGTGRVTDTRLLAPTGFVVHAFHLYRIRGEAGGARFEKLHTFSLMEEGRYA